MEEDRDRLGESRFERDAVAIDLRPAFVGLAVRRELVSRDRAQVSAGSTRADEQAMDTRQSLQTPNDGLL